MKVPHPLRAPLAVLAACWPFLAWGETSRDEILKSFRDPPTAPAPIAAPQKEEQTPAAPTPHGDIVYMDPLEITEPYRGLDAAVSEYDEVLRAQKFHFENGGTILKKVGKKVTREIKCKFEPRYQKWDIIKFSW